MSWLLPQGALVRSADYGLYIKPQVQAELQGKVQTGLLILGIAGTVALLGFGLSRLSSSSKLLPATLLAAGVAAGGGLYSLFHKCQLTALKRACC